MDRELTKVGFVRKAHRFSGAVRIEVEDTFITRVLQSQFLFIQIEGCKIPFAVKRFEDKQSLVVHFESVSFPEDTDTMVGNSLYIEAKTASGQKGEKPGNELADLQYLIGYTMKDLERGVFGVVAKVEQYPGQIMVTAKADEREILIPWVDAFVEEIDQENQFVLLQLPEGLV